MGYGQDGAAKMGNINTDTSDIASVFLGRVSSFHSELQMCRGPNVLETSKFGKYS